MSPQERPNWCQKVDCPRYPGGGICHLRKQVLDNWFSKERRTEEFERLNQLAEEDRTRIIQKCAEV